MNDRKTRGHDENRGIICAACGKKDLKCAKVQPSIESAIQAEISKAYSVKDVYFPNGVCSQCRKWLFASKKKLLFPKPFASDGTASTSKNSVHRHDQRHVLARFANGQDTKKRIWKRKNKQTFHESKKRSLKRPRQEKKIQL